MTSAAALPLTPLPRPATPGPRPPAGERLWTTAARAFDEVTATTREWDDLVRALGAPVDQSRAWCGTWWHHYGRRRAARIFEFRTDDELVGILPMALDTLRLGPVSLRVARLMAADHAPAALALPIRGEWLEPCLDACLTHLVHDERCEAVLLGPLSDAWTRVGAVRAAVERRRDLVHVARTRVVAGHGIIELDDDLDAWRRSLSRSVRIDLRRSWRRLQRDHDVSESIAPAPFEEFHAFAHLHALQWQREGRGGHFADWPDAYRFNRSLVRHLDDERRVRLYALRAGSRAVARQFAFMFGSTCHCRLSARAAGEAWHRYGLGRLSLVRLAELVHAEGARVLDVGTGVHEYKRRLGARMHEVHSLLLVTNQGTVTGRARLLAETADALDRLYYRGWFQRLAPRLGRHRPLWKSWILSRF